MKKAMIKLFDNLYIDMEKARQHKYYKRVPKKSGKGFDYFYTKDEYDKAKKQEKPKEEKKGGLLNGIMSFFGLKDLSSAEKKVNETYNANKDKLQGIDKPTFSSYLNEYLLNKSKWDQKLSGEKKEKPTYTKDKKTGEVKKKDKTPVMSSKGGFKLSIMKQIAGVVGKQTDTDVGDKTDSNQKSVINEFKEQLKNDSTAELEERIKSDTYRVKPKNYDQMVEAVKELLEERNAKTKEKEEKQQERLSSQEWEKTKINTEGLKRSNGEDINPKDIKSTFKTWGEDLLLVKNKYGNYSVLEAKTGLGITRHVNGAKTQKEALDIAKQVLAFQGKESFNSAIDNAKKINEDNFDTMPESEGKGGEDKKGIVSSRDKYDISKLKKIGSGSDRNVYDLEDGNVLKVAKNGRGLVQNETELKINESFVAKVKEHGRDYVIMEKLSQPEDNKKIDDVVMFFRGTNDSATDRNSALIEAEEKFGLKGLSKYNGDDIVFGDLMNQDNWGLKNNKLKLVDGAILDRNSLKENKNKDEEFNQISQESSGDKKGIMSGDEDFKDIIENNVLKALDKSGKLKINNSVLDKDTIDFYKKEYSDENKDRKKYTKSRRDQIFQEMFDNVKNTGKNLEHSIKKGNNEEIKQRREAFEIAKMEFNSYVDSFPEYNKYKDKKQEDKSPVMSDKKSGDKTSIMSDLGESVKQNNLKNDLERLEKNHEQEINQEMQLNKLSRKEAEEKLKPRKERKEKELKEKNQNDFNRFDDTFSSNNPEQIYKLVYNNRTAREYFSKKYDVSGQSTDVTGVLKKNPASVKKAIKDILGVSKERKKSEPEKTAEGSNMPEKFQGKSPSTKRLVVKSEGSKYYTVEEPVSGREFKMYKNDDIGKLNTGEQVYLSVLSNTESSKYGSNTQYYPVSIEKQGSVEKPRTKQEIVGSGRWNGKVYGRNGAYSIYVNGNKKSISDIDAKVLDPMKKATSLLIQELQKAKKAPIGTVSGDYKKVAEGKWEKVSDGDKKKGQTEQPEDKKDKKPEESKDDTSARREKIKNTLKKVTSMLADAFSMRDTVGTGGQTVEQAGEDVKEAGKEQEAKNKKEAEKKKKEQEAKKKTAMEEKAKQKKEKQDSQYSKEKDKSLKRDAKK